MPIENSDQMPEEFMPGIRTPLSTGAPGSPSSAPEPRVGETGITLAPSPDTFHVGTAPLSTDSGTDPYHGGAPFGGSTAGYADTGAGGGRTIARHPDAGE